MFLPLVYPEISGQIPMKSRSLPLFSGAFRCARGRAANAPRRRAFPPRYAGPSPVFSVRPSRRFSPAEEERVPEYELFTHAVAHVVQREAPGGALDIGVEQDLQKHVAQLFPSSWRDRPGRTPRRPRRPPPENCAGWKDASVRRPTGSRPVRGADAQDAPDLQSQ